MANTDIASLHPVFVRQMKALTDVDIDELMENYTPDAALIRFDGVSNGTAELREAFTSYLTLKPTLIDLTAYVQTDDTIFYRAIMNLGGEPEHAFGTLVIKDGKIWRQTAGFGS